MPSFAAGTHAHLHTVDSALVSLAALGVSPSRISLRRAGRQAAAPGTIVRQSPRPGEPLLPSTLIELDIAGLGFTHALPVGMWDSGGEEAAGTREILQPFDDPLEKLNHWFREGAPLFRIAPDDTQACSRWLALFGVDSSDWPRPLWFRLASLIAAIAQLSCTQQGCAFVLQSLLGLPVKSFRHRPNVTPIARSAASALGQRSSRLGVDMLLGDRVEDLAMLQVEIGPVNLATYEQYTETEAGAGLLARTLDLLMPSNASYEITWSVLDKTRSPRLGMAEHNARLGINTHMGGALDRAIPPKGMAAEAFAG